MIPHLETTAWAFWMVSVVGAAAFGSIGTGMTIAVRATRRRLHDTTVAERIETAKQAGLDTWRGQAPVAEPTVQIAGSDWGMPQRVGIVLPDQTLTMPTVAEQDATTLVADFPAPASVDPDVERMISDPHFAGALEAGTRLRDEVLESIRDEGSRQLDLADMFDVEPDEPDDTEQLPPDAPAEEPEEPQDGDTPGGSVAGEPLCAESLKPMVTMESPRPPRIWPSTSDWSPEDGVWPNRWTMYRWRLHTWWNRQRHEAAALQQMEARGWEPGEAPRMVGRHRPEFVEQHRIYPRGTGKRVLRHDWQQYLPKPQTGLAVFPSLECQR